MKRLLPFLTLWIAISAPARADCPQCENPIAACDGVSLRRYSCLQEGNSGFGIDPELVMNSHSGLNPDCRAFLMKGADLDSQANPSLDAGQKQLIHYWTTITAGISSCGQATVPNPNLATDVGPVLQESIESAPQELGKSACKPSQSFFTACKAFGGTPLQKDIPVDTLYPADKSKAGLCLVNGFELDSSCFLDPKNAQTIRAATDVLHKQFVPCLGGVLGSAGPAAQLVKDYTASAGGKGATPSTTRTLCCGACLGFRANFGEDELKQCGATNKFNTNVIVLGPSLLKGDPGCNSLAKYGATSAKKDPIGVVAATLGHELLHSAKLADAKDHDDPMPYGDPVYSCVDYCTQVGIPTKDDSGSPLKYAPTPDVMGFLYGDQVPPTIQASIQPVTDKQTEINAVQKEIDTIEGSAIENHPPDEVARLKAGLAQKKARLDALNQQLSTLGASHSIAVSPQVAACTRFMQCAQCNAGAALRGRRQVTPAQIFQTVHDHLDEIKATPQCSQAWAAYEKIQGTSGVESFCSMNE